MGRTLLSALALLGLVAFVRANGICTVSDDIANIDSELDCSDYPMPAYHEGIEYDECKESFTKLGLHNQCDQCKWKIDGKKRCFKCLSNIVTKTSSYNHLWACGQCTTADCFKCVETGVILNNGNSIAACSQCEGLNSAAEKEYCFDCVEKFFRAAPVRANYHPYLDVNADIFSTCVSSAHLCADYEDAWHQNVCLDCVHKAFVDNFAPCLCQTLAHTCKDVTDDHGLCVDCFHAMGSANAGTYSTCQDCKSVGVSNKECCWTCAKDAFDATPFDPSSLWTCPTPDCH